MPRILSLFNGTGSITRPFAAAGWEVQSVDIDPTHAPTICTDILQWDYSNEPTPDVIFAGPDCTQYSIARTRGKHPRNFVLADSLVAKCWEIISHFSNKTPGGILWFIENPDSSLLWGRQISDPFPHRVRLDYCQYGRFFRKRTKLATNTNYKPRPLCNAKTCHACIDGRHQKSAQQGPCKRSGVRVASALDKCSLDELHAYPAELCEEIFQFCQTENWQLV